MKRKIYTLSHDVNLLKEIDNDGSQFTAEEHSYAIEKEFSETVYKTKESLLRYYLPLYLPKSDTLGFLIDSIKENGYKNILFLGAGQCVLEYLLKMSLPEDSRVVACDFSPFTVKKAKEFFTEITIEQFDFFKDDFASLQSKLNIRFDLVVLIASAYVMDDKDFIKLFGDLKKEGVKKVIDFHSGYIDSKSVIYHYLSPFTSSQLVRKIFRKPPLGTADGYRGKFHGYSRNRGELRRLYKKSGFEIEKELSVSGYKYVAILS